MLDDLIAHRPNLDLARSRLDALAEDIRQRPLPQAMEIWGGAGIQIVFETPARKACFYAGPRYVETRYALELSWLFAQLREVAARANLLEHLGKFEFFGRLATASQSAAALGEQAPELLLAVLEEANRMVVEMEDDYFDGLEALIADGVASTTMSGDFAAR